MCCQRSYGGSNRVQCDGAVSHVLPPGVVVVSCAAAWKIPSFHPIVRGVVACISSTRASTKASSYNSSVSSSTVRCWKLGKSVAFLLRISQAGLMVNSKCTGQRWRETLLNIFVRASFPSNNPYVSLLRWWCRVLWVCCVLESRAKLKLVYASVCLNCILPLASPIRRSPPVVVRWSPLSSFLLWFCF